ncbi:MAG TPA: SUMF1/EgtB/PvdO family nonheme iron enzyme [Thermoanaerobaculia bacterium]|nr:SUMF1/EgtB/PvdO family nonheme iron enzyme [Thermoanaerobaculia bacterium]
MSAFRSIAAFEIAIHQVTNREYAQFVDATGHIAPPHWRDADFDHPEQPVVAVSWFDAVAYCEWRGVRLPTEAEWELAARGGIDGALYPWGDEPPQSRPDYATRWLRGPERVGRGTPNGYGLYDMCENVHEWCSDWFVEGKRRASRGGSWRHQIKISRCDARSSLPPDCKYADYGFRVARSTRT